MPGNLTETDPRTYAIIGAAMEVHCQLGCGFLEPVYQEAIAIEFVRRNIPFVKEIRLPLEYKGQVLETKYCADFICFNSVVVELKALARMGGTEDAQVINYLKATGHEVGMLINFQYSKPGTPPVRSYKICVICGLWFRLSCGCYSIANTGAASARFAR